MYIFSKKFEFFTHYYQNWCDFFKYGKLVTFAKKFGEMNLEEIQRIVIEQIQDFVDNNGIEIDEDITLKQRLIGTSGIFDSMDLVNFLVDLEETLEDKYDQSFSLQDERAMSRSHSPFINPEELSKFILELHAED